MSELKFKRFPETKSTSLKAWNAADELILEYIQENKKKILICNDQFGYLTCHFKNREHELVLINDLNSQEEAIHYNLDQNKINASGINFEHIFEASDNKNDIGILKIPKSNEEFELFLIAIHQRLEDDGQVICGFMTKHFNPTLLKLAGNYFENIEQSKAKKKARLLILSKKKTVDSSPIKINIDYKDKNYQQYLGVFSAQNIDYATQFLLENINFEEECKEVIDLASGNGIISSIIGDNLPDSKIHLVDDSYLAIASSKLNLNSDNFSFHHQYHLNNFESNSVDWVITNPPIHFGHTIDINIPLELFNQAHRVLKNNGVLTIVANTSIGYLPHLDVLFSNVEKIASNSKFIIYECIK